MATVIDYPNWFINWANVAGEVPADEPELLMLWHGRSLLSEFMLCSLEDERYEQCAIIQRALNTDAPRLVNSDLPLFQGYEDVTLRDAMLTKEMFLAGLRSILHWWRYSREHSSAADDPSHPGGPYYLMMDSVEETDGRQAEVIFCGVWRD